MSTAVVHRFLLGLVAVVCVTTAWFCNGGGEQFPNTPPITRLSNIPPPDSFTISKNPRLTLNWVGDDPDGYVVAFRYRWSFRLNSTSPFQEKPWTTLLNISNVGGGGQSGASNFALLTDADDHDVPAVYKYFATLPPANDPIRQAFDNDSVNKLNLGEALVVAGFHVWGSNPKFVRYPVHTNPNSGTFIFDSQDSINPHTFEVCAIDNTGDPDPHPAKVDFGTPRVKPPDTEVTGGPGDTVMVLDHTTDTFQGIQFTFQGFDPNSRTIDYSWVVDRDVWPRDSIPWSPWSEATSALVTAANFPDPYATKHTFYVRSRNEFGSIDTLGYFVRTRFDANTVILGYDTVYARREFFTNYPPFQRPGYKQKILLLNYSYAFPEPGTPAHPSRRTQIDYYRSILDSIGLAGKYDTMTIVDVHNGAHFFPGRGILGRYSAIIVTADVVNYAGSSGDKSTGHVESIGRQANLRDYCYIGGKLIFTSWDIPYVLNSSIGDFVIPILHYETANGLVDTSFGGFRGASGEKGYPDLTLDMAKVDTTLWGPGLRFIYGGRPHGFGEIICRYQTANPASIFNGVCSGVRYLGITYDVIYFGVPLYYVREAKAAIERALDDIGELHR